LIEALRYTAHQEGKGNDAAEALRQWLNQTLLARSGKTIVAQPLSHQQKAVGRVLTSCVLADGRALGRPSPSDVPGRPPSIPGYDLLRLLGQGGFSKVFLARHQTTGDLRAVKVINLLDDPKRLDREIGILRSVQHENLVRYFEH